MRCAAPQNMRANAWYSIARSDKIRESSIRSPRTGCISSAWQMSMRAAWLYDHDKPCGAEANSAKFLGARAGHAAAWQAIMTHGGFGYAKEYHVERLFREVSITR